MERPRAEIEYIIEAATDELDEWLDDSVEHPNEHVFENARDKFARLLTLVDALRTLGPPLSLAKLEELN